MCLTFTCPSCFDDLLPCDHHHSPLAVNALICPPGNRGMVGSKVDCTPRVLIHAIRAAGITFPICLPGRIAIPLSTSVPTRSSHSIKYFTCAPVTRLFFSVNVSPAATCAQIWQGSPWIHWVPIGCGGSAVQTLGLPTETESAYPRQPPPHVGANIDAGVDAAAGRAGGTGDHITVGHHP